ncbi:MAG: hypothetical protein F4X96_02730 [Gammaproteobacteria bacterium]|nr:hypothetical protein [Chromatiales bacterium]MYE48332.1 hypothetical protein [Gammaproteobacteria bacterium]
MQSRAFARWRRGKRGGNRERRFQPLGRAGTGTPPPGPGPSILKGRIGTGAAGRRQSRRPVGSLCRLPG